MQKHLPPKTLLLVTALALSACGIPYDAARLTLLQSTAPLPAADEDIRAALKEQPDAWSTLSSLLRQQQLGSTISADPKFSALITQTAALARRQRDLITQNLDTPAQNRTTLHQLHQLWQTAHTYLTP